MVARRGRRWQQDRTRGLEPRAEHTPPGSLCCLPSSSSTRSGFSPSLARSALSTHVRADTSHATRTQAYRVSDSHRGISCTVVSADADGDAGARRTRSGKASASRRTRVAAATYLDSSTESEMSFALESPARAHWGLAAVQNHGIGRLTGVDGGSYGDASAARCSLLTEAAGRTRSTRAFGCLSQQWRAPRAHAHTRERARARTHTSAAALAHFGRCFGRLQSRHRHPKVLLGARCCVWGQHRAEDEVAKGVSSSTNLNDAVRLRACTHPHHPRTGTPFVNICDAGASVLQPERIRRPGTSSPTATLLLALQRRQPSAACGKGFCKRARQPLRHRIGASRRGIVGRGCSFHLLALDKKVWRTEGRACRCVEVVWLCAEDSGDYVIDDYGITHVDEWVDDVGQV